ncbi:4-hydroxy-3-methylbut-2-enyl diphosphate reductase, partial [Omnitrophica bacterium]|nr:4-hydroxy-3-methylbut-2-enyl diphosphate reductase [Candidatus Omnitrophota bacterium]
RDTIKRQDAVRQLTDTADIVMVVGGKNSANTRRLVEVCRKEGRAAYHIEKSTDINPSWLAGRRSVGIASGASTPDWVVQNIIDDIRRNS